MRDAFSSDVNREIACGHFPKSKLIPLQAYFSPSIDSDSIWNEIIHIYSSDCLPLLLAFSTLFVQGIMKEEDYRGEVNYWINLGTSIKRIDEKSETTKEAINLCPVVTLFDKAIWFLADFCIEEESISGGSISPIKAVAWSMFLREVQAAELNTGYTINMNADFSWNQLFSILLGGWDITDKERFIKLSDTEVNELKRLSDSRKKLYARYQEERKNAQRIVQKTKDSWELYIQLINELSEKETKTIEIIKDNISTTEKIKAINDYLAFIDSFDTRNYQYKNTEGVSVENLEEIIDERDENAADYVCTSDDEENPFRLTGFAAVLTKYPQLSFNYLHILRDRFRLSPTKANAEAFASVALQDLMKNLDIQRELPSGFEETIESFYEIASTFVDQNSSTIKGLSFHTLQDDSIAIVPGIRSTSYWYELELLKEINHREFENAVKNIPEELINRDERPSSFYDFINSICAKICRAICEDFDIITHDISIPLSSDESTLANLGIDVSSELSSQEILEHITYAVNDLSDEDFIKKLSGLILFLGSKEICSPEKILSQRNFAREQLKRIRESGTARQIVISLNIIIMMQGVLRFIAGNDDLKAICNSQEISKKLLRVDDKINSWVYSDLDDDECVLSEYRLEKGYDTKTLQEQENRADRKDTDLTIKTAKDAIDTIIIGIENQSIEELFESKEHIREAFSKCPDCAAKEQLAEWIDQVSSRLCNAVVNRCINDDALFENTKAKLFDCIGEECCRLPKAALDSLTTAELLYNEYAKPEIAEKGFDYSSISALYYQAFEVAYNEMIWKPYVDVVNALIDDHYPRKGIYRDYFPGDTESDEHRTASDAEKSIKRYYFSEGRVKQYCVFGSFTHLLEEVKKVNTAPMFCKHIASLSGYNTVTEMFQDDAFMVELVEFTNAIKGATDRRNEASHGGNIITIDQCRIDKEIVLSELEEVRNSNIGLIQRLLQIIKE